VPRRRLVAAGFVVVATAALGACGDDGPVAAPPRDQVAATVHDFARAAADKDYARLCGEILSDDLVTRVQRAGITCRMALQAGLGDVRDPEVRVGEVRVTGDMATAEVRSQAAGQRGSADVLRLVREHGGWRIAALAAERR
jgi:predicted small lipoprotein YifL